MREGPRARRGGDTRAAVPIPDQIGDRFGERVGIADWYGDRASVARPVRDVADRGADGRHPATRCLQRRDVRGLVTRRDDVHVRAGIERRERVGRLEPMKRHTVVEPQLTRQRLHRSVQRVGADDVEMDVERARPQLRDRAQQRRIIFHRIDAADADQPPRRPFGSRR